MLRLTSEQFAHLQKYLAKIEKGKVKATWEQIGLVPASEGGVVRTCISPDGRPYRLAIAYNGDGDWAVVDPDSVPTEFDDGMFAFGFESVAEAAAYIREYDPENPPAWKIKDTDDDPF